MWKTGGADGRGRSGRALRSAPPPANRGTRYRYGGPAGAVLLFPFQGFDEGDDVLDVLRGDGKLGDERRNFRAPGYAGHLDEYRVRCAPVKGLQALHVIRQFGEKPERRGAVDAGERVVADYMASNAVLVRQFPAFFRVAGPGAGRKNDRADGQGNGKGQAFHGPSLPPLPAGVNCGERRAAGVRGLRARRRAVVPDRRESQGMEWESIKSAFEVDGLLRDIYVFETRSANLDRFLAANKD